MWDDAFSERLDRTSVEGLRLALVVIFVVFGLQKFSEAEARGIVRLVENSPLTSWLMTLGYRNMSRVFGVAELTYGLLLALGFWRPGSIPTILGALGSCVTFLVTLSFLITTPTVFVPDQAPILSEDGLFLLKDAVLLAASFFLLVRSMSERHRA